MIGCVDVHYSNDLATAACVVFKERGNEEWVEEYTLSEAVSAPYEPGKLYLRELPPIQSILSLVKNSIECVVVDGNVWLDDNGRPGLGAKLHEALGSKIPVVGIAKSYFFDGQAVRKVIRGESSRPLYVTSIGIDLSEVAEHVRLMNGAFRVPATLKRADSLCRGYCKCQPSV